MSEIMYEFNETKWTNFKNQLIANDTEDRSISFCTNFSFCRNTITYTQTGVKGAFALYVPESMAAYSRYSQSAYTDNSRGETSYYAYTAPYSNRYGNYGNSGGYYNRYADRYTGYSVLAHDRTAYSQCSDYYNYYNCGDYYNHYNYGNYHTDVATYNQATGYSQGIADTQQLPSKPVLLGTENSQTPVLAKTVKLALFSNDKDTVASKKLVYYDIYIQKIANLNGTVLASGQTLTKVVANQPEASAGAGYTFNLDTTQYTDGYYRIIAVARNAKMTVNTAISGDKDQTTKAQTFYAQDNPDDSIVVSGNYDGVNLTSGLLFGPGETASSTSMNGTLQAGKMHDMYSISKVLIRQNRIPFFSFNNATTNILNFIFANDDSSDTNEGVYDTSKKETYKYGEATIVNNDSYAVLRGWTKGIVASLKVVESDTDQYIQATATLHKKSTGEAISGSTVTAQFPTNKSSASAYTEIPKGAGEAVEMEGYFYWPATILNSLQITEGIDDLEIRTTINEYKDVNKSTLMGTFTSNTTNTTSNGSVVNNGSTNATVKVDRFSPNITSNAIQNTWLESANVSISSDDRVKGSAYSTSGTGSGIKEMIVKVTNKATNKVIQSYTWSVANGVIPSGATNFSKNIEIQSPLLHDTSYFDNIAIDVTTIDNAGNTSTKTIDNIKIDNTTTIISTDIAPSDQWFKTQRTPVVSITKPGGKPFTTIKIAETTSPTAPSSSDSAWTTFSPNDIKFTYNTTKVGRTTNTHYIHVIVDDGLHDTITKTIGPYKVDLEAPSVNIASTAGEWKYRPYVIVDTSDIVQGSPIDYIEYTWKKSNGAIGGTNKVNIGSSNLYTYNDTYYIDIEDNTYEPNISCEITVADVAGNIFKTTVNNLKADRTDPVISINPIHKEEWVNVAYDTVTTVSKPSGMPVTVIKIAETQDPTPPDLSSAEWKNIAIVNGGAIYNNLTTGKSSGEHYVHVYVEKGTFDDDADKVRRATFGPYKTDFINPDVISFDDYGSYVKKGLWYWENPTYELIIDDDGGSLMKSAHYSIVKEGSSDPQTWEELPALFTNHYIEFDNGENSFQIKLEDNATNKQFRINPNLIRVDTENPEIHITPTIHSKDGGTLPTGEIVGYLELDISTSDITSGVKVAKYAITDSPTPPALNKVGTTNSGDLGRTGDGWIDFSAYSDIGVNVDLKAPGKSYVYVYVEDIAGRKYNSTLATVDAPNEDGIYLFPMEIDIIPTYFTGLELINEEGKLIFKSDTVRRNNANITNLYAIKNISSMANFKLHYSNYSNEVRNLVIETIDAATGEVMRTSKSSARFEIGDTIIDGISPYNFTSWWVNGVNGKRLPSGVYEVKVTLTDNNRELTSTSAFVVIKSNDLVEPVISYKNFGDRVEYDATFGKDNFLEEEVAKSYPSDILNFMQDMRRNNQTTYKVEVVDKEGKVTVKSFTPSFDANGIYKFEDSIKKYATIIATTEDAFGNIARDSQVINFIGDEDDIDESLTEEEKAQIKQEKAENTEKVNETTNSVSKIETPSADNYIINGKKQKGDKFDDNPFTFIK